MRIAGHDAMLLAGAEDGIDYDDAVTRTAEDLAALDDLELVQAFKDALGDAEWTDEREMLIGDAMEQADIERDADYQREYDRLMGLNDDRKLLQTCKRYLSVVKARYGDRMETHWDHWRERFVDKMAAKVLDNRRQASIDDQYS